MSIDITSKLPKGVLESLEKKGADVQKKSKIWIVELNSEESQQYFKDFLEGPDEVDPAVYVTFGPPLNPFIAPQAQLEVWNIISSYQPLTREAFLPGGQIHWIPIPNGVPPGAGFQYHHAKIALQKVQEEIERPGRLAEHLPCLVAMNDARPICYFNIVYANCIVSKRLHRTLAPASTLEETK